ncbi:hypothetical protein ACJMK2_007584, partial [Sinanodonta woodiana]
IHTAEGMQMAHTNNSYDNHEGSDMHPNYNISLTNSSDKSALNGSLNSHHLHSNRSYDDLDSLYDSYHHSEFFYQLHHFEGKIYVYVWTFLAILTTFGNVLIVAVF